MLLGHISPGLSLWTFISCSFIALDFIKGRIFFVPVSPHWRAHLSFWGLGGGQTLNRILILDVLRHSQTAFTNYGNLKRLRNSAVYFFHSSIVGMEGKITEILMTYSPTISSPDLVSYSFSSHCLKKEYSKRKQRKQRLFSALSSVEKRGTENYVREYS